MPADDKSRTRRRNRSETEARILAAAERLIARDGFTGFGVNALAAEAGYDKKLIARYFGGLDGVLTALAGDVGFWTGGRFPPGPYDSYAEFIESLAIEFRSALRESPLLQRVLAWELIQPSDTLRRIDQLRSKAIIAWMADARGELAPPPGVDAPAINAILLAAIRYLALAKVSLGRTAGIDLTSPENEARIDAAFRQLIRLAYEAPKSPKQDA